MKKIFIFVFMTLTGLGLWIFNEHVSTCLAKNNSFNLTGVQSITPAEVRGLNFIQSKLQNPNWIIHYSTSFRGSSNNSVVESMGQMMEYLAMTGDSKLFEKYAKVTDEYFLDKKGYYYWEINARTKKPEQVTASIDDLRIFKAYYIAHQKNMGDYSKKLNQLASLIYKFDVDKNNYLTSYYFGKNGGKGRELYTFYLDAETLKKLAQIDKKWQTPLETTIGIKLAL